MKVVSIGTDRNIFKEGSSARIRMIEYGCLFDELHIIIFSKKALGYKSEKISNNVWIYPTHSLSKFLYMRDAYYQAKKIISPENWVVSAQDPFETGNVAYKLKKKFSLPMQIQVHTDFFNNYFIRHSLLNSIRVSMARKILPHADGIRVVSERIKNSIIKETHISENKIDILPIYSEISHTQEVAVDLHKKYPQYSSIILMVGRLESEKNIGFALDIFKEVLHTYPSLGLVIIGEGSQKKALERKVKKLGLTTSVVFESWQQNIADYYKTADIFLHTSLYEGYGLVLAEAAQAGLPIVTSNVGIAGSILIDHESACICSVDKPHTFTNALIKILSHPDFKGSLVKGAKEAILKNTLPTKQEYLTRYKNLIEKIRKLA